MGEKNQEEEFKWELLGPRPKNFPETKGPIIKYRREGMSVNFPDPSSLGHLPDYMQSTHLAKPMNSAQIKLGIDKGIFQSGDYVHNIDKNEVLMWAGDSLQFVLIGSTMPFKSPENADESNQGDAEPSALSANQVRNLPQSVQAEILIDPDSTYMIKNSLGEHKLIYGRDLAPHQERIIIDRILEELIIREAKADREKNDE